ncbi:MAG: arsenical pump-driving ATPase [Cyclobacteriaceae bacterium]|nr:arsenical pump-driving ATPase [Cyclobacteriaceae bacterium]
MEKGVNKFLFFTGKGGVGKTSLACATAVKLADEGKKVLLISTDPASNLEDVLESPVKNEITPHRTLSTLFTININPEVSADEYRQRAMGPLKGVATLQEINKVKEQLSGACTTEIASFDEFSRFITGEGNPEAFDVIIFDTAPTGHTIRLLELPAAWDTFLDENPKGASCIGPSSALKSSKERYKKVIASLRDAEQTTFYLVARSETSSLKEAARTSLELKELGLINQRLLINGVFSAIDKSDKVALKMEQLAQKELMEMPDALKTLATLNYPLLPYNVLGLEKLRSLLDTELQKKIIAKEISTESMFEHPLEDLSELVDELEGNSPNGLILTMGKGGVGKTIVAATIATLLARRGHEVLLTTTDPAAHITDFINQLEELPGTLTVEHIDPKVETKNYVDKVMNQKGATLDAEGKKLLLEDLKSPCTEEVAVFHAFSSAIYKAKRQFVVIDTAPTGHTLLLLDTTGSYHREILKKQTPGSVKIKTPYMFLQDQNFAKIVLVALPETTPMREAEGLQNDLKRAGIVPFAWVVNQCLSALRNLKDPLLRKRAASEIPIIDTIKNNLSKRTFGIPYLAEQKLLPALLLSLDKTKTAIRIQ